MNSTRIIGIVLSIVLFTVWIFVDMIFFPSVGETLGYPVFELVAYGSWFVIILIILVILSMTGNIPTRQSGSE
ncbi:MAG: hypothetical protein ACFFDR_12515 [Candidatus Thorarchaeota archaeon]